MAPHPESGPWSGHLAALFAFSAGPVGLVVQKLLSGSLTPFAVVATQMTLGACLLWAFSLGIDRRRPPGARSALAGLALGVLHPGLMMLLNVAAAARLDSVTFVMTVALFPPASAVLARLVLKEPLRPPVLVGLAVSLAGLLLLASRRHAVSESELSGFALAGAALACGAAGVVSGRRLNLRAAPWHRLAALQVSGAAAVAWLGGLAFGFEAEVSALSRHWRAFAYLVLVMTFASYLAYNFALSRLPVPWVALHMALGPVPGTVAAVLLFGERIDALGIAGLAAIVAGGLLPVGLDARQARRARASA